MTTNSHKKPTLLIHLGYHKTGTTFWQKNIFSADNINFIERKSVRENILAPSPYDFTAEKLNNWLGASLTTDKLNVISEEELLGNIHSGGNGRSITFESIERIAQIDCAEVILLIFIRNQINSIDSCYRQYIKRGGCFSFNDYINPENRGAERHRFPGFSLEHFKYDDVIEHCYQQQGKNNVVIFPYENFLSSPQHIVELVSEVVSYKLEISEQRSAKKVNKSLSNLSVLLARFTNRFFTNDLVSRNSIFRLAFFKPVIHQLYLWLDALLPKKMITQSYVSAEFKTQLNDYYADSNRHTQELTGIDLQHLNYPSK